jgi:putative DNA primase/helicase
MVRPKEKAKIIETRFTFSDEDVAENEREESFPENLTQWGNARRLVRLHGNDIRHCYESGWMVWNKQRWEQDRKGRVARYAKDMVRTIYVEAAECTDESRRKDIATHAKKSESRDSISAAMDLAKSETGIPILATDFDQNKTLFNCLTGTAETETGKIREHRREDYITMISEVQHDRTATCSRWDKFLEEVTAGDKELISFLQRSVGYSLTGSNLEQCFWLLFGDGSNGKSTFIDTVLNLMGDYGAQIKTEVLLESRYEQKGYHVATLRAKRFVAAVESNMNRRLAVGLLKQATGMDRMVGRYPYGRPFEFYPEFKLWLSTNHRPKIDDTTESIWRRIHAVPFTVHFKKPEDVPPNYSGPVIDRTLPEQLKKELPGILNWAIKGSIDWRKRGLDAPKAVLEATWQYRKEEDVFGTFLEDCCELGDDATETATLIYKRYSEWCEENGEKAMSQTALGKLLPSRGFISDRDSRGERIWRGLGLKYMKADFEGYGEQGT